MTVSPHRFSRVREMHLVLFDEWCMFYGIACFKNLTTPEKMGTAPSTFNDKTVPILMWLLQIM